MADKTPFELDALIHEQGGEVLPAYEGVNAPVFSETPEHGPTPDDLIEMYGDIADAAFAGVKAGIPDNLRIIIADHRAAKEQSIQRRMDVRRHARSDKPWWN
jgi:hypothetical protein